MQNKVVIITGGTSGIGKACAFAFGQVGAKVVITGRKIDSLTATSAELAAANIQHLCVQADVSRWEDNQKMVEEVIKNYGKIDILVNNAGISMRALFQEVDISVIEKVMQVNFYGAVYATKCCLPYLLQSKGSIVAVSSIAGHRGLPARTGYSASKFAMQGFFEALRTELLPQKVHVLVAAPGFTASNIRNTALAHDGTMQGETPRKEAQMMPAEVVAQKIVQAVKKRQRDLVLTRQGKITVFLNKFFPQVMDKLVFQHLAKEKNSPLQKIKPLIWLFCILMFFTQCKWGNSTTEKGKKIAQVYDQELYENDLIGIAPRGSSPKDSALLVQRFIDNWIRKQLLLREAQTEVVPDEAELKRKLEEYKFALITHEFEKNYIQKKLDTLVNAQEIQAFYDSSKANFELKHNIVKANLAKIPANSADKAKILQLLQNYSIKNSKELQEIGLKNNAEISIKDTTWLSFEEVIQGTPFAKIPNKTDFLRTNNQTEATDNGITYLMAIKAYKIANDIAPLPFVQERIKLIILNKRKTKLINELEQNILKKAEKGEKIKLFYQEKNNKNVK